MIEKIISGGQTGADQAGLNVAIELGLPHGGSCPRGRKSEAGRIPERYNLVEHESSDYPPRTAANVRDSDGTVVFTLGAPERGSALTIDLCERAFKPSLHLDLERVSTEEAARLLKTWIEEKKIKVLNVAGNRESKAPGIGAKVETVLMTMFL
jgi:hypothetical protein